MSKINTTHSGFLGFLEKLIRFIPIVYFFFDRLLNILIILKMTFIISLNYSIIKK